MSNALRPPETDANSLLNKNRFSPITDHDQAGVLWIASLLSGIYAVLTLFVRLYIKRKCFGNDDWACLAATIIGAGSFTSTYIGLSHGLGKSFVRNAAELQGIGRVRERVAARGHHDVLPRLTNVLGTLEQAVFASRVTFIFAVALAKCSVTLLIKRLFSQDMQQHRFACNIVQATTALWALGALIAVSVNCSPEGLVNDAANGHCRRQLLRWWLVGMFDAITELLIVALSCGLVWRLQMKMDLKVRVILAFSFRLPLIAIAAVHIYYIHKQSLRDLNLHIIPSLSIEQVQVGYALVSATIPNLKSFIMSFDTAMMMDVSYKIYPHGHFRLTFEERTADTYRAAGANDPNRLSGLSSQDNEFIRGLRPERLEYAASVQHVNDASAQSTASARGSQEGGIRIDSQWTVEASYETQHKARST